MTIIPPWVKVLAIALLFGVLMGGAALYHRHVYQLGWDARDAIARVDTEHAAAVVAGELVTATAAAVSNERALRAQLDAAQSARLKEKANHEKAMSDLSASVRAGNERLHCPGPGPSQSAPGANPGAPPGPSDAPGQFLVPDASVAIFGVASGINDLVQRYNGLVDAYESARDTCNAR
jgi:hypothetical protein